ncbi:tetratricopeptide repeat protein [Parasphingorhabdus sp.]|uniref:tetratricopeptide repeat protein n=1 Tax=Parasphingorhabdus sp. TaxID=2709688 RepID=UPI002B276F56|nr:tetratricopeptide repeat protein [Parasphingorhabdus sp.]
MAEVQIIRICSLSLCALVLAGQAVSPALASRGDSASALNRYVEARLAESSNELQTAATIYAEGLKEQPDNVMLAGKAYVNAIEVGNFDLAAKAVGIMQLHGTANPEMPLIHFAEAFAQRDWNGASLAIAELKSLNNFAFLAPFLEGWLESARGRNTGAAFATARSSETAKYYLEEQLILHGLANRREREAKALLAQVIERNEPRMAPVRVIAAQHFWAQNDPATALAILKMRSSAAELRLFQKIEAGQKKNVGQKVTPAIGLAFIFERLSSDLAVQQAQFLSLVTAQAGKRVAGDSDYADLVLGRAYAAAENHDLAIAEFARIGPESPYYLIGLSSQIASFVTNGDFDQAIVRLDSALAADPDSPELYILKGQSLQAQGENKAAAAAFESAIELGNKLQRSDMLMANYWLALGGAQEQAGIWPGGLQSLQKANELLPDSPTILNYLGYAQLERRENQQAAVAAIKRAHELRSDSPAITDSLGWAYFVTGEHDRAVTYLESALEGQPQDPTINEHLGDAYWTVGRLYEARYAWKSAKLFAEGDDVQRLASKIDLGLRPELVSP